MTEELEELRRRLVVGHKADGRSVYDEAAKAELVALCLRPGASVSRLARECGVNANQVCRWLREQGHHRRPRSAVAGAAAPSAFTAVPVVSGPAAAMDVDRGDAMVGLQVRLPNGVAVELRGVEQRKRGPKAALTQAGWAMEHSSAWKTADTSLCGASSGLNARTLGAGH